MIIKGFRFGLLLQLAIGPVCLYILNTAVMSGFGLAFLAVIAVCLIDALYIFLAFSGISAFLKSEKTKLILKIFGAVVLIVFGLASILSSFNISILPSFNFNFSATSNVFLYASLLTASNPLTILFWAGVFSSKVSELNMSKKDTYLFAIGCVLSSFIFLTAIAALGFVFKLFINDSVILILNVLVGIMLVYFGIRNLLKKA